MLNDLPGNSSSFLVHLNDDFGGCRHRVFAFEDGFLPDSLTGQFHFASDEVFESSIELFFMRVEEKDYDLRLPVLLNVLTQLVFPAIAI